MFCTKKQRELTNRSNLSLHLSVVFQVAQLGSVLLKDKHCRGRFKFGIKANPNYFVAT